MNHPTITIPDILRSIDRNGSVYDVAWRYNHTVQSGSSRAIMNHLDEETVVYAYAHNPGNGIVIFGKKKGVIAYSVVFSGYPNAKAGTNCVWCRLPTMTALELIRESVWEQSHVTEGVEYEKAERCFQWPLLAKGTLRYICSSYRSSRVSEIKPSDAELSVRRLRSGRLRIEINGYFCPCAEIARALSFLQENDPSKMMVSDLPQVSSWRSVIAIEDLPEKLMPEIIVQGVAETMKQTRESHY